MRLLLLTSMLLLSAAATAESVELRVTGTLVPDACSLSNPAFSHDKETRFDWHCAAQQNVTLRQGVLPGSPQLAITRGQGSQVTVRPLTAAGKVLPVIEIYYL